jgi:5-methylcytosine-specific restriction endonuclease McrA
MSDKNILEEYFVWEERSLTEVVMKSENNGNCVVSDTMKVIENEYVKKKEKGIELRRTEKEKRNREYLKRKYKKREEKILLKRNDCNNIDEYKIKKEVKRSKRKEDRRRYKVRYKRIHYFKHISKVHNKRSGGYVLKPMELWGLLKRQRMLCGLTGRRLNRNNISLDHIVPLSKGGSNEPSNLRFVHIDANTFKMDMDDSDLLELAKDIVRTLSV